MDDLYMSYEGNLLTSVRDNAPHSVYAGATDFYTDSKQKEYPLTYNDAGSLMSDAGRKIAKIDYDLNNNPVRIQFTNGNVTKYVYSATGEKLRVTYQTAVPNISVSIGNTHELAPAELLSTDHTDYLLGGSLTLKNGRIDKYHFDDGYYQASKQQADINEYLIPYYYDQDHLGNIRRVISSNGHTVYFAQKINYYPFGAQLCDGSTDSNVQARKFNGKEFDKMHGLNTYDYGARQYNPITARWDRVDPLAEKYYSVSPYVYCVNNPMKYIDIDGKDVWEIDANGNVVNYIKTKEHDRLNVINSKGESVASMQYEYGTISHQTIEAKDGSSYDMFTICGDDNGTAAFEMLAQNTDVEWTIGQFDKNSGIPNLLTTSHSENSDFGLTSFLGDNQSLILNLRVMSHNHPGGSIFPSSGTDARGNGTGDLGVVSYFNKKYPDNHIQYNIYTLYGGIYKYYPYYEGMIMTYGGRKTELNGITVNGKRKKKN